MFFRVWIWIRFGFLEYSHRREKRCSKRAELFQLKGGRSWRKGVGMEGGVSSKGGTETPGRCSPVETLPTQGSASLGDRCLRRSCSPEVPRGNPRRLQDPGCVFSCGLRGEMLSWVVEWKSRLQRSREGVIPIGEK